MATPLLPDMTVCVVTQCTQADLFWTAAPGAGLAISVTPRSASMLVTPTFFQLYHMHPHHISASPPSRIRTSSTARRNHETTLHTHNQRTSALCATRDTNTASSLGTATISTARGRHYPTRRVRAHDLAQTSLLDVLSTEHRINFRARTTQIRPE